MKYCSWNDRIKASDPSTSSCNINWCFKLLNKKIKLSEIEFTCSLLYFLDYINGGELFTHLSQRERFSENEVQIYIGEIVLALEHLHKVKWVYPFSGNCKLIIQCEKNAVVAQKVRIISLALSAKTFYKWDKLVESLKILSNKMCSHVHQIKATRSCLCEKNHYWQIMVNF